MDNEILTVAQAATYLQVSEKTILKWIKNDKLIASQVGRIYRIRLSDINAYLAANSNGRKGVKVK